MTTNGSIALDHLFTDDTIRRLAKIKLSYHPIHEQNPHYDAIFEHNVRILTALNVYTTVIYVMLPERIARYPAMAERFTTLGAVMCPNFLVGEHQGKRYPEAYSPEEREYIVSAYRTVHTRFLSEYGFHQPTMRCCRAGYSRFNIYLESGRVNPCEHQAFREIFNFLSEAPVTFTGKKLAEP
ncbi:hypothetical protein HM1_1235 [Heliomicrobium modesticaldum Ice1]|uniref:Uncharacterized protein n=1 Tax=Heliobacterium modesticaldum (strain ATCC 51547 / Ice1) TaxID=498761 RepID=B0TH16_HELMI|nr:hypothetical protein [Heliomicrobium modesticaldum]ABZ83341.1 hypothetical protein HM1_1235 [Heliomicrobium modesticaldum Ice1]